MSDNHKEFLTNIIKEKLKFTNGIVLNDFKEKLKSAISTKRKIEKNSLRGLKSLLKDADSLRMIDRRVLNVTSLSKGTIKNTSESGRDFNTDKQVKLLIATKKSEANAKIKALKSSKKFIIQEFRNIGHLLVTGKYRKNKYEDDSLWDDLFDLFDLGGNKGKKKPKRGKRPKRNKGKRGKRGRKGRRFSRKLKVITKKINKNIKGFKDKLSKKNQKIKENLKKRISETLKKLKELREKLKKSNITKKIKSNINQVKSKLNSLLKESSKRFGDFKNKVNKNLNINQNKVTKGIKNTTKKLSNWLNRAKKAGQERYRQIQEERKKKLQADAKKKALQEQLRKEREQAEKKAIEAKKQAERKAEDAKKAKAEKERIEKEKQAQIERQKAEKARLEAEKAKVKASQIRNVSPSTVKSSVTFAPSMNGVPGTNIPPNPTPSKPDNKTSNKNLRQRDPKYRESLTNFIKNTIGSRVPLEFLNKVLLIGAVIGVIYESIQIYEAYTRRDYKEVCIGIGALLGSGIGGVLGTIGGILGSVVMGAIGSQLGAWLGEALYTGFRIDEDKGIIDVGGKIIYRDYKFWVANFNENAKKALIQTHKEQWMLYPVGTYEPPTEEEIRKQLNQTEEDYKKECEKIIKEFEISMGANLEIFKRNQIIEELSQKYEMPYDDIMKFLQDQADKQKITIKEVLDAIVALIDDGEMTLQEAMKSFAGVDQEPTLAPAAGPAENPILAPDEDVEYVENVSAPNDKKPVVLIKNTDGSLDNKSNAFDILKDLLEEYGPELGAIALADLAPYLQGIEQGGQDMGASPEGSASPSADGNQSSGSPASSSNDSSSEPKQSENSSSSTNTSPPSASAYDGLGSVVAKYEAGGNNSKGTEKVESDTGGAAYGRNQLNASKGSVEAFLKFAKTHDSAIYNELAPLYGDVLSTNGRFAQKWKELARKDNRLTELEGRYRREHYFDLGMKQVRKNSKLAGLEERIKANPALQEMILSMSTQHGEYGGVHLVMGHADINANMSDEEIIKKTYEYRDKYFKGRFHSRYSREAQDLVNISQAHKQKSQEQKVSNPEQSKEQAPVNKDANNISQSNSNTQNNSSSNTSNSQPKIENPEKNIQPAVIPKVDTNKGINVSNKGTPNNSVSPKKEGKEPSSSVSPKKEGKEPSSSVSPKKEGKEPSTSTSKGNNAEPKANNNANIQSPISQPEASANGGSNTSNISNKNTQNNDIEKPISAKQFDKASTSSPSQQTNSMSPTNSTNAGGIASLPPQVIPNNESKNGEGGTPTDASQADNGSGSTPIFSIGCEESERIRRDVRNELPR